MKIVFILGAGASHDAGGPLMNNFLDIASSVHKNDPNLTEGKEAFDDVFNALGEFSGIHNKCYLDLNNIEEFFGAIEMARILKKWGNRNENQIEKLKKNLIKVIYKTLEQRMIFKKSGSAFPSPGTYELFGKMLREIEKEAGNYNPPVYSFITFNYDLALDNQLLHCGYKSNYHLTEKNEVDSIPLLKLHGSINWGMCDNCGIVPIDIDQNRFKKIANPPNFGQNESDLFILDMGSKLSSIKHDCGSFLQASPVLIPPTIYKGDYHKNLFEVWGKAANLLSNAEIIIVIGYSLPQTDSFFKYLYSLGSQSLTHLKMFGVLDRDKEVQNKFEDLVGRGMIDRKKFNRLTGEFRGTIDEMKRSILQHFYV